MHPLHNRHHGFTLIEIMVVVTIIGIMTGIIAINVITQDPQKELNQEAMRFLALIELAQEEALFSQQEIGVVITEEGYQFARWAMPDVTGSELAVPESRVGSESEEDEANARLSSMLGSNVLGADVSRPQPSWVPITNDSTFREHKLDDDFELVLEVEHEQIDLTGGVDQEEREKAKQATKILEEEDEELKPSIFIMSSGELSPFVLEMMMREDRDIAAKVSGDETGRIWIGDDDEDAREE